MATTGLTIAYRPIRLGFLIRNGNLDDLITAAGLNTMLAGGIYNPVIPIGSKNELAKDEEIEIKFYDGRKPARITK